VGRWLDDPNQRRRTTHVDDTEIGRGVREVLTAYLAWHDDLDRLERSAEIADVVEGYRVVNGGQVDPDGRWEITDAESGELLASGVGRESFDAAWQANWTHIDSITSNAFDAVSEPTGGFGLPVGFRSALAAWAIDAPAEAREVLDG